MNIGILTGGGDCPGLNAAIRGFVLEALGLGHTVHGVLKGWKGLVQGLVEEEPLTAERVWDIHRAGGTILLQLWHVE